MAEAATVTSEFYPVSRKWLASPTVRTACGGVEELPDMGELFVWKSFNVDATLNFHIGIVKISGKVSGQMEQAGDHWGKTYKSAALSVKLSATIGFSPAAFFFSIKGKMEVACLECDSFLRMLKTGVKMVLRDQRKECQAQQQIDTYITQRLTAIQKMDKVDLKAAGREKNARQSLWTLTLADRLSMLLKSFAIKVNRGAQTYKKHLQDVITKLMSVGIGEKALEPVGLKALAENYTTQPANGLSDDEITIAGWLKLVEKTFPGMFNGPSARRKEEIGYRVVVASQQFSKLLKAPVVKFAKEIQKEAIHTFFDNSSEPPLFEEFDESEYLNGRYCGVLIPDARWKDLSKVQCEAKCKALPRCAAFSYNDKTHDCYLCHSSAELFPDPPAGYERYSRAPQDAWASYRKVRFSCFDLKEMNAVNLEPCPGSSPANWDCYPKLHDGSTAQKYVRGDKAIVGFPGQYLCALLKGYRPDDGSKVETLKGKEWTTARECSSCCQDKSDCRCSIQATFQHNFCPCNCFRLNPQMPQAEPDTIIDEVLVMFSDLFESLDMKFLTSNQTDVIGEQLRYDHPEAYGEAHVFDEASHELGTTERLVKFTGEVVHVFQRGKQVLQRLAELAGPGWLNTFQSEPGLKSVFETQFPCAENPTAGERQSPAKLKSDDLRKCCVSQIGGWLFDFCTKEQVKAVLRQKVNAQLIETNEEIYWTFIGSVVPLGFKAPGSKSNFEVSRLVVEKDRIKEMRLPGQKKPIDIDITVKGRRLLKAWSFRTKFDSIGLSYFYRDSQDVKNPCTQLNIGAERRQTAWINQWRSCKCKNGFHLSDACGAQAGQRKFDPSSGQLLSADCKCIKGELGASEEKGEDSVSAASKTVLVDLPPKITRMYGINSQKHLVTWKIPLPLAFNVDSSAGLAALFATDFLNGFCLAVADSLFIAFSQYESLPDSEKKPKSLTARLLAQFSNNSAGWNQMLAKWFESLAEHGKVVGTLKVGSAAAVAALGAATGVYKQTLSLSIALRAPCVNCQVEKPWAMSFFAGLDTNTNVGATGIPGDLLGAMTSFSGGLSFKQSYKVDLSGLFLLHACERT
eukprot:TRINITY_DN4732_c0_g2_i1.p1 TRINITY_DN4732_c0_g2~~TRINITY_DN4732_c0_g2_i1.p1  ORF type:complete len:1145 (+),score=154.88 TRINITY_DN4732_c0_g2_i1:197-3436(+)